MNERRTPIALRMKGVTRRRGVGQSGFQLDVRSFVLQQGEAVVVTGPSGSGKSTLLDLIGLVLKPDNVGEFLLWPEANKSIDLGKAWQDRAERQLSAIRARHLGYILQTGGILPFLSVMDNILLSSQMLGKVDKALIQDLTHALDINHVLPKKPKSLSIGERQRACIARSLAHRPSLILADEPTASLDPVNADRVMELLMDRVRKMGVSAIIVSHDRSLADRLQLREARVVPAKDGARSVLDMAE